MITDLRIKPDGKTCIFKVNGTPCLDYIDWFDSDKAGELNLFDDVIIGQESYRGHKGIETCFTYAEVNYKTLNNEQVKVLLNYTYSNYSEFGFESLNDMVFEGNCAYHEAVNLRLKTVFRFQTAINNQNLITT